MDLIYSQSITHYDLIPHVARLAYDLARIPQGPHVDGVIGFVHHLTQQMRHMSIQTLQPTTAQAQQQLSIPS